MTTFGRCIRFVDYRVLLVMGHLITVLHVERRFVHNLIGILHADLCVVRFLLGIVGQ
jgi:hypothetical protein